MLTFAMTYVSNVITVGDATVYGLDCSKLREVIHSLSTKNRKRVRLNVCLLF